MRAPWYSKDRLKPFYGRRRVRKLCDHIDLLKRMLDRTERERDAAKQVVSELREAVAFLRCCDLSGEHGADHPTVIKALEHERELRRFN